MSKEGTLSPDQLIALGGQSWSVRGRIGSQKVIVQPDDPKAPARILTIDEATKALQEGKVGTPTPAARVMRDLEDFSEKEWEIASSRHRVVVDLLSMPNRSRLDVEAAGRMAQVNASTVYDWIKAFQVRGYVTDLVPSRPGPKSGSKRLDPEVERIIEEQVEAVFLNKKPMPVSEVHTAIALACRKAGVPCPAPNTVRARVETLNPEFILIRQNRGERARNKFRPIKANFPDQGTAMSVVQMDHTLANIVVVDEVHRLPISRPWITLAIDVHSRIIAGFYLSFDAPSSVAVAMCMVDMVTDKRARLAELEVPGEWPVQGKPGRILTDNAREFRAKALKNACKEHTIDIEYRPRGRPNWGGHIERMMKTSTDVINTMPGTTYSNPKQKAESDPEATAALTLKEFETIFVDWIVNVYNVRLHSQIDCSPIYAYRRSIFGDNEKPGIGIATVENEEKFRLDLMPFEKRNIDRHGVQLFKSFYWDEVLKSKVVEGYKVIDGAPRARPARPKHIFRYDPRDMSVVYLWDPDTGAYYKIPYRNTSRPAVSAYEIRKAKAEGRANGIANIDEDWIFETIDRMRTRTDQAVEKSKTARKNAAKRKTTEAISDQRQTAGPPKPQTELAAEGLPTVMRRPSTPDDDPFARPIRPFDVAGDLTARSKGAGR